MRHFVVTVPPAQRTIRALYLLAAKQCLPPNAEVHAGNGVTFDRVAREMGLAITHRHEALTNPRDYRKLVPELVALLKDGEKPRIVLAHPEIVDWLDGTEPGVPEAIYRTEILGASFCGLKCEFRDGKQLSL